MTTQAQIDQLKGDGQAYIDAVNAYIADAEGQITALTAQVSTLTDSNGTLTTERNNASALAAKRLDQINRIVAKVSAADAADATGDQARADIIAIAGE